MRRGFPANLVAPDFPHNAMRTPSVLMPIIIKNQYKSHLPHNPKLMTSKCLSCMSWIQSTSLA